MNESIPATGRASRARIGWFESAGNVVAIGALSLLYAIGHRLGAHPVAFILYALVAAAFGMLLLAGRGPNAVAIARHPLSWVIGGAIILIEVFYFVTLMFVAPAHGNLILRIGVPIAMLSGWLLFRRRPPGLALAAGTMIVAAVGFVIAMTNPGARAPMAIAGVLAGTFMVVRGFAAEFHPWNRTARTIRDKLRLTGIVVLLTSALSLIGMALLALAIAFGAIPPIRFMPSAAAMLDGPTILLGCLGGGTVLTVMAYLGFSSVVKIGTENTTAMLAFSPLTTWAFQEVGVALGWIVAARPEPRLIAAMTAIVVAVLMIFWTERRRTIKRVRVD